MCSAPKKSMRHCLRLGVKYAVVVGTVLVAQRGAAEVLGSDLDRRGRGGFVRYGFRGERF